MVRTEDSSLALLASMEQTDAIMALEGFERSAGMRALDEAMLSGRASVRDVRDFLMLHAKLLAARSILAQIGQGDDRRAVIEVRYREQAERLRNMAIAMDGAVRVAFNL
jgi:hypothetical protein